jgi:hypothetical protein
MNIGCVGSGEGDLWLSVLVDDCIVRSDDYGIILVYYYLAALLLGGIIRHTPSAVGRLL